jgi:hypothetical protein
MQTKMILSVLLAGALIAPATASAAKTCQEAYYQCLNDTYDTKGWARIAADLECAARYAGCLKAVVS